MQRELTLFANGMRKLVAALKAGDDSKRLEANAMLDEVGRFGAKMNALADENDPGGAKRK